MKLEKKTERAAKGERGLKGDSDWNSCCQKGDRKCWSNVSEGLTRQCRDRGPEKEEEHAWI